MDRDSYTEQELKEAVRQLKADFGISEDKARQAARMLLTTGGDVIDDKQKSKKEA